jgi:hypothetical protein
MLKVMNIAARSPSFDIDKLGIDLALFDPSQACTSANTDDPASFIKRDPFCKFDFFRHLILIILINLIKSVIFI